MLLLPQLLGMAVNNTTIQSRDFCDLFSQRKLPVEDEASFCESGG